jgi:hypothetical protein
MRKEDLPVPGARAETLCANISETPAPISLESN